MTEEEKQKLKVYRNGFGVQIFPNYKNLHEKYIGNWIMDKKNGIGTYYFSDNTIYSGNFKDNDFHGFGKCTWSNGSSYEGDWMINKMHGNGVYTSQKGFILKGLFVNGLYNFVW